MSFINNQTKEINCKVIYAGPALAGKASTLKKLAQTISAEKGGKNKSEKKATFSEDNGSLYFDFLPLTLGSVKGFQIRLHLYTMPEQALYDNSRRMILKGVDGIVFVAHAEVGKMEANMESLAFLKKTLAAMGVDPQELPFVFQYNKRDLKNTVSVAQLNAVLNEARCPAFETIAAEGEGILKPLQAIAKLVLMDLKKE